jgi:MYXO-CTERM domain-containing protein
MAIRRVTGLASVLRRGATAFGLSAGLVLGLAVMPAHAGLVTFFFSGTLNSATLDPVSPFPDAVDFLTPFSGSYSFDPGAPNSNLADPMGSGTYSSPTGALSLTVGGLSFSFSGLSVVTQKSPGFVFYGVSIDVDPLDPTAPVLTLSLTGLSDLALASSVLPLAPPSLALFDATNAFFFSATVDGNQIELQGALDALTVPEPPLPIALVAAAALAASALRRRR